MTRKAVIDMGTNTFNLLIAEVNDFEVNVLYSTKEAVALGMGGINSKNISADATERALNTLNHFHSLCNQWNVSTVRAIATSAVRDAENQQEFCQLIKQKLDWTVEVIDGEQEGRYIAQGVGHTHNLQEDHVIMDMGGGSTEFIFVSGGKVRRVESIDIGVSRIFQMREYADPLSKEDVDFATEWMREIIGERLASFKSTILVGASGSFETFFEVMYETPFAGNMGFEALPLDRLNDLLIWLRDSSFAERNANPWIIPIRKKMGPFAAIQVLLVMEILKIEQFYLSGSSLKEGVLRD